MGAGSVGQVYGTFLQRAGAEVSVLVRERYRQEAEAGFALFRNGREPASWFHPAAVLTSWAAVRARTFDQIWLCVSSTALRAGLLEDLKDAVGDALLVALQPGLRDRDLVAPLVPEDRLVVGLIAFSAWHAPLPGEAPLSVPGQGYWFPPLTKSLFEGPRADEVVEPLRAAGCPAGRGPAQLAAARGSAVLLAVVAGLETVGWRPSGLRSAAVSQRVAGAAGEALAIGADQLGAKPGLAGRVLRPWAVRLASFLLPVVAPVRFDRFLEVHFTKVGAQTLLALEDWIAGGARAGLETHHLRALRDELVSVRSGDCG